MTTKQADRLMDSEKWAIVHNPRWDETFAILITERSRYNVTSITGAVFDRDELEIVKSPTQSAIVEL